MPQVVAVWCEAEGHDVTHVCYTGFENLVEELPAGVDLVFVGAFTEAAQTAYALSNLFRFRGAVTALGGPHARCFPEDAAKYFDYVFGFTDRTVLRDVLADCSPHRPRGLHVRRGTAAALPPGRSRALEVHRADASQGSGPEARPDARQPRMPVHLQLLHRRDGSVSGARCRSPEGRSPVPSDEAAPARCRLARPELRSPLRRDARRHRGGGPPGKHRLCRREQPLDPHRAAPRTPPEERLRRPPPRASSPGTSWETSRRPGR